MQIFPQRLNLLPAVLVAGGLLTVPAATFGVWFYLSPKNLQVGYAPVQPVPYSHRLHVGDLGMDCRYCHANVEQSHEAMVPATQTCMGCHAVVRRDSPRLEPVRQSWASGKPVPWVRVHKLPDHAFFDHSAHLAANVGCRSCHGQVDQMDVVSIVEPISMGWCLECHRDPAPHVRAPGHTTDMSCRIGGERCQAPADCCSGACGADGLCAHVENLNVNPPEHCSGCHR